MSINLRRQDKNFMEKLYKVDMSIMLKESEARPRTKRSAWPSESMCQLGPIAVGECKRALFYRIIGLKPTEPMSITGRSTCDAGSMYEDYHLERFRENGLLKETQIPLVFVLPKTRNQVTINGRMDAIIQSDGLTSIIELKSVSEFKAMKIMGSTGNVPMPSPNNLMQAMLYCYYVKYTEEGKKLQVDNVYLMCINRGNGSTMFYKIDLSDEGWPSITAYDQKGNEIYVTNLQDVVSYDTLISRSLPATSDEARLAELRINIEDIFAKFDSLYDYVLNNSVPPCDYSIVYSEEALDRESKLGRLSKMKFNKGKKGEAEGDNRCKYCMYKTKCLEDQKIKLKEPSIQE